MGCGGEWRSCDIHHNRAENGCHTAIGKIGGQCGSPGSDCRRRRKVSAAYSPGAGGGADLCLALSKSKVQQGLRAAVYHQRGAYLCRDGPADATEVGPHVVLLHGSRADAEALWGEVGAVLAPTGLRLWIEKTRVCHIDEELTSLAGTSSAEPGGADRLSRPPTATRRRRRSRQSLTRCAR